MTSTDDLLSAHTCNEKCEKKGFEKTGILYKLCSLRSHSSLKEMNWPLSGMTGICSFTCNATAPRIPDFSVWFFCVYFSTFCTCFIPDCGVCYHAIYQKQLSYLKVGSHARQMSRSTNWFKNGRWWAEYICCLPKIFFKAQLLKHQLKLIIV